MDWDLLSMQGIPMADLLSLLLVSSIECGDESYADNVTRLCASDRATPDEAEMIEEYERAFGLPSWYKVLAMCSVVFEQAIALASRRPVSFRRSRSWFVTAIQRICDEIVQGSL
jgi:hypothetical protein